MNKKDVQSTNTRRATVSHRAYYNNAQHFICQIDRVRGYNDFFFAFCLLLLLHVFNIYHFIIYNCRLCAFFCVEYVCQQTHHPIQAWIVSIYCSFVNCITIGILKSILNFWIQWNHFAFFTFSLFLLNSVYCNQLCGNIEKSEFFFSNHTAIWKFRYWICFK